MNSKERMKMKIGHIRHLMLLSLILKLSNAIDCDPGYYYKETDPDTQTGLCQICPEGNLKLNLLIITIYRQLMSRNRWLKI